MKISESKSHDLVEYFKQFRENTLIWNKSSLHTLVHVMNTYISLHTLVCVMNSLRSFLTFVVCFDKMVRGHRSSEPNDELINKTNVKYKFKLKVE